MPSKFASGKYSISECDRCGFRFNLKQLKPLIVKHQNTNILVCAACWTPDQPQLFLGETPINDPQAVRNPRPDVSYQVSGNSGLKIGLSSSTNVNDYGVPEGGSRIFQWGFNPVGGARDNGLTPNNLVIDCQLGTVTITVN